MPEYMYGVRKDGSVICINDLDDAEFGLRCECKCPQCKRDLQACALTSQAVSRYFRHNNEEYNREGISTLNGCTATSANESGLHMMAKELVAEAKSIALPSMSLTLDRFGLQFGDRVLSRLPQNILLRDSFIFEYNDVVEIEKPYPEFRPDVSISSNGQTFLIEIAVTHRVNAGKQKRVEDYGLPMLEIDLSSFVETGISREELCKLITESTDHKKWISLSKELMDDTRKDLTGRAIAIQKHLEELDTERKEYFLPNNYSSKLSANRSDRVFDQYAKRELHFDATHEQYPFFIDIPIAGEVIFECDRRIWQGKIFDRWVYYRTSSGINMFSIWDSLVHEMHIPYNQALAGKFSYPGSNTPVYLPYAVIRKYLGYLEKLGFIDIKDGKWAAVLEKNALTAPNQEYAAHLQSVLHQIDGLSLSAPANIEQRINAILQAEKARKEDLECERLRVEAEQRLLKEEAERKAAEMERQRQIEAMREAIQVADYDQTDHYVVIGGQRWVLCTSCQKPVKEADMVMIGFPTMNKGRCRECARR